MARAFLTNGPRQSNNGTDAGPIGQKSQLARASNSPSAVDRTGGGKLGRKNYAVGLEMSCPGGACYRAPEIPSANLIAAAEPSKCELAHNRGSFLPEWPGLGPRL
jgi:hypothetical protein